MQNGFGSEDKKPLPLFQTDTTQDSLEKDVDLLGSFLLSSMPLRLLFLVQTELEDGAYKGAAIWNPEQLDAAPMEAALKNKTGSIFKQLAGRDTMPEEEARGLLPECGSPLLFHAVRYSGGPCGLLAALRKDGEWSTEEKKMFAFLCKIKGAAYSVRTKLEEERYNDFLFNAVLDGIKAGIYITDPETDRILFMNQSMKKEFGLQNPEGEICWRVLQRGMSGRCPFCPVGKLQQAGMDSTVYQWEEINSVTGHIYQNYDSMIRWTDGRTVHLQQSVDTTELKSANTDELTRLLTRRPGKAALADTLHRASAAGELVTVGLYDINQLKEVNDHFGHAAGDRLLAAVADAVSGSLGENEFAFRLSGDEFVVVFQTNFIQSQQRLENILSGLAGADTEYEMGFCYGLAEVPPGQKSSVDEVLFLADERMYEQKRRRHILRNESRLSRPTPAPGAPEFTYDATRLYDALVQSTDDYIYVCNMKTGVFRYSRAMVEEFDLPGEVIKNAAAVWGAHVHKKDRAAFLEANQEIEDGRAATHCVEYRAKNRKGEWVWVRCRGHLELDESGSPVLFAGFITNLGAHDRIDHLTGLYNRTEFEESLSKMMQAAPAAQLGLMSLAIEELGDINERYGHTFGDEVIRIAAHRLHSMLPEGASLFRLDGNEFGLILRGAGRHELATLYKTVSRRFGWQQEYEGKKYPCTLAAGCALYPQDADNPLWLARHAHYSLDYAKSQGKRQCVFFSKSIYEHHVHFLAMLEALQESVENGFSGFSLRFHPIMDAESQKPSGVEVLARWQCAQFGEVLPSEFFPILEQSELILPVSVWILTQAVRSCKAWLALSPRLALHVNLSAQELQFQGFSGRLRVLLREEGFPAENLVLELPEHCFSSDLRSLRPILNALRKFGVRLAVDGFGGRNFSPGSLKGSPADMVKVDRSFVGDMQPGGLGTLVLPFVSALCRSLKLPFCIQGIETEAQREAVASVEADFLQGFLFGQPLTAEEFALMLAK